MRAATHLVPRVGRLATTSVGGLVLALLLAGATDARGEPPAPAPTVIVLSLDGVRHDQPDRGRFPGLARMERDGARASLVPVFPSSTFPSHASLATGAPPDVHGILNNRFYEPGRGRFAYDGDASWLEAEPLWVTAERQGVRSGVFFWVCSETDWRGVGATYRRAPFDSGIGETEKVSQILAWLDLPEAERPRLIMSWWHGTDDVGHDYGPESRRIADRLRGQDGELSRLLAGLDVRRAWPHTTVIVVSDHGMTSVSGGIDVSAILREHGIEAEVSRSGPVATFHLVDPARRNELTVALNTLEGVTAYAVDALPQRYRFRHPKRSGDVVAIARAPMRFRRHARATEWISALRARVVGARGGHGYDPLLADMHGIFFAVGRGVAAGARPEPVAALDLAPTVAQLLGIEPPQDAEGAPIPGLDRPPAGDPPADQDAAVDSPR